MPADEYSTSQKVGSGLQSNRGEKQLKDADEEVVFDQNQEMHAPYTADNGYTEEDNYNEERRPGRP